VLIGVISDTHGLLRPEALAALRGVDLVLHAGDIGAPEILEALEELAPVTAVRGNNDIDDWARALPETAVVRVGPFDIALVHDIKTLPAKHAAVAVVSGHSHRPRNEWLDGILYFNPGSAGPRRFTLPITIGRLTVTLTPSPSLRGEIIELSTPLRRPRNSPPQRPRPV
jgi:putative phosphoesterase